MEWESHYPDWGKLEKSFWEELNHFPVNFSASFLNNILEFVGIDNESGGAAEKLMEELNDFQQADLAQVGYRFFMPQTRWQIAEFLKEANVPNNKELLEAMIDSDEDKYVQRRALLSLAFIDSDLACKYAFQKLKDENEYMRLVSLKILKEQNSSKLEKAKLVLKDDPSSLVRKELKYD